MLLANPAIPFDENTAVGKLMTDCSGPIFTIYVLAGPGPEVLSPKIVSVARNDPPVPHHFNVSRPAWMFQLTVGSEVFNNKPDLGILILNAYIAACTEEERATAAEDPPSVYIRLMTHIDERWEGPYAYGYLRPVADALPVHQRTIHDHRPPDRLCCEINGLHRGHFVFFPRAKFAAREPVTLEDLTIAD
jgi:hypothetical protein